LQRRDLPGVQTELARQHGGGVLAQLGGALR